MDEESESDEELESDEESESGEDNDDDNNSDDNDDYDDDNIAIKKMAKCIRNKQKYLLHALVLTRVSVIFNRQTESFTC